MRLALAVVVLTGCYIYDPVDDIPHREFHDTGAAVRAILAEATAPRVYAIGEYHPTRTTIVRHSPLNRFTDEIMALLQARAQHLIVEAWLDQDCRSAGDAGSLGAQVQAATGRAASTQSDLQHLVVTSERMKLQMHGLPMTCIEHGSVFDPRGRVDFYRLLLLVTEKLGDTSRDLVGQGRTVIVYGGALHNDLYPRWPLADLSYTTGLAQELGRGRVLEIDLVVPEVVASMALVRLEPWFPLLGRASPGRVIVWPRAPDSYVVILPAQSEAVARVARPVLAM